MNSCNHTRTLKAALQISGMAFLALILSERRASLYICIIAAVLLGFFLLKTSMTVEELGGILRPGYVAAGAILCVMLGCGFYNRWLISARAWLIADKLGIRQDILILLCGAGCVLLAVFSVSAGLSWYINTLTEDFRENGESAASLLKSFLLLAAAWLLGISSILRANFNYIDDMGRVAGGYKGWSDYSRFISEALSSVIHMDHYLTDVSPLPQLLAVLVLALSGVLLLYILRGRTSLSVWDFFALVPLGLNPYFLECLSYKYDAPYMALSILGAIIPFLYRKKNSAVYIFISMVGMMAVCATYQAAVGIYPMIVVLLAFKMWNSGEPLKKTMGFCLRSAAGCVLGLAVFYFAIMIPAETYVSTKVPFSLKNMGDLLQIIYFNMRRYYTLVGEDFKPFWIMLIVMLAIGFIGTAVRSSRWPPCLAATAAAISLISMCLLCFGVYPALSRALFAPRAMYGFGVWIALVGVGAMEGWRNYLVRAAAGALSMAFFAFSLTYGNALYVQKEYTDFRIQAVIGDLNDMELFLSGQPVVLQISGTIGQSPIIANMPQDYNMLNRLVPITFQGQWWWGQAGFFQYYGLKNVIRNPELDLTTYDLPILEDKMYHTIRGNENYILVELK